ncbi:hypothetical protein M3Y96_00993100 [Aphelenchoides besseyi]|nr:hypothetical protein M3Y96_00993100 [Aphelenchoides besseyi]
MADFNAAYLRSCLGIVKLMQIVITFVCLGLLTSFWANGGSCFGKGTVGVLAVSNLLVAILNLLTFGGHLIGRPFHKREWLYAAACSLFFGLLFCWNVVDHSCTGIVFILMFFQCFLFLIELLALVGRCDCYLRVGHIDYHWTFGYEEMERVQGTPSVGSEYGSI